jgi:DNA-binding response OmpR family regulator
VVDDEPAIRWLVSRALASAGYEVEEVGDGLGAVAALDAAPDLIVLDLMMPGMDGLAVLAEVRRRGNTPVIMLTAMATESDRIAGLDEGADDYLVKPFSIGELQARVRALLRRRAPAAIAAVGVAGEPRVVVDRRSREAWLDGAVVALTRREFDLLAFLAEHPKRVVGAEELLEQVWQSSSEWQDRNTVKEHVRRLRHKLAPDLIKTVRGAGYLFDPGAAAPAGAAGADGEALSRPAPAGSSAPA